MREAPQIQRYFDERARGYRAQFSSGLLGRLRHAERLALFTALEPGGLKFELICFVDEVEASGRTKSDLHYAIFAAFKAEGIPIFGTAVVQQVALKGEIADALADRLREGRL